MSLAVAIQMDPIEHINIEADSSFVLALEAQRRGHRLFHYLPRHMFYREGRIFARIRPLVVRREAGRHATSGTPELIDLASLDVILMRQDPPFDMAYITATHMLEMVHPGTLVVNDPVHVRNAPLQHRQRQARISPHRFQQVLRLQGHRLHCRAGDVRRGRAARQAKDRAAGVRIPVRRAKADEGRHDDDTIGIGHARRQLLHIDRRLDDAEAVAEPLHDRAGDEHGAFQAIRRLAADLPAAA
jgi:hypothetical protein